jgi:hypothetical protein
MVLVATETIEYGNRRINAGEKIPDWLHEDSVKALKKSGAIEEAKGDSKSESKASKGA